MQTIVTKVIPYLIAILCLAFFNSNLVQAKSCTLYPAKDGPVYYGRDRWCGYFENDRDQNYPDNGGNGSLVLPIIGNNEAIPSIGSNAVNDVASLISLLKSYNTSGTPREKAGSAFIINTMLGRNGPGKGKVVSADDWTDITTRLNSRASKGKIDWDIYVGGSINSYYQGVGTSNATNSNPNDDAFYISSYKSRSAIVIYNDNNSIAYQLWRVCANPIGDGLTAGGIPLPADYSLTPTVTTNPSGGVEPNTQLIVKPLVTTTGSASAQPTQWQISKIILQPSVIKPVAATNATLPCSYYDTGDGISCSVASFSSGGGGTGTTSFTSPSHQFIDRYTTVDDNLEPGTNICYALSVQPRSHDSSEWSHSATACVVISKKPKTQVLGGDLWVGVPFIGTVGSSNVDTSTVTKGAYTFGSWIEYGIFATGIVTGAGSGSAYSGDGLDSATICKESLLTFANTDGDGSTSCNDSTAIGQYATTRFMSDIAASFSPDGLSVDIASSDISDQSKTGVFTGSGQISLAGGTLQAGRWLVINAPAADITITGDITYTTDVLASIYDIPQLVIIAKNITIAESVTQVDAWLIARGDSNGGGILSTCTFTSTDPTRDSFPAFSPFPGLSNLGLDLNKCNQKLTINGPVMAQKLYLLRTAGSGTGATSGDPAEVFNLRPDAFLWASARAVVSGRLQTVHTTELPPRL